MTPSSPPPHPTKATDNSRLQRLGSFLQVDPDNALLLRDYALEALRAGEHRAAALAIERLGTTGETTTEDELLRGRAWRLDGQPEKALTALSAASARWPDDDRLALEQAASHFDQHAFEAALDALPRPSTVESALDPEVRAMRVRLMHHLGRLDAALSEAFAGGDPLPSAVARAVLPVLVDSARLDEAQALAQTLLQAEPNDLPLPYEACEPLAAAALDRDDIGDAQRWCDEALQRRQDDGRVWLLHGLTRLRAGEPADAIRDMECAASLMPSHAGTQLALGWAHVSQNDLAAAHAAFEAALSLSPAFSETHGSLAVVAALRGEASQAQALVRTAQRLDRDGAAARWAQVLLQGKPDPEQVARMAREVIAGVRKQRPPAPRAS